MSDLDICQLVLQTSINLGGMLLGASVLLIGVMLSVVIDFDVCHPNPPCPDFYRKDNLVPICISLLLG